MLPVPSRATRSQPSVLDQNQSVHRWESEHSLSSIIDVSRPNQIFLFLWPSGAFSHKIKLVFMSFKTQFIRVQLGFPLIALLSRLKSLLNLNRNGSDVTFFKQKLLVEEFHSEMLLHFKQHATGSQSCLTSK